MVKLFCSKYWQNPQITAAVHYFQKQPPEVFCKQGVLKKIAKFLKKQLCWSLILITSQALKLVSCEFCITFKDTFFTEQLCWLLLIILDYIILYQTRRHIPCQGELAGLNTNLANLYFSMNLTNFVPSHTVAFSF